MVTLAMWINPEHTTMEVCTNGKSCLVVVNSLGEIQVLSDDTTLRDTITKWIEAGNQPRSFDDGGE